MNLGFDRWITQNGLIGVSMSRFSSKPRTLQKKLENELRLNAVSTSYETPQAGIYARFGYAPLQGIFNLFEHFVINSSLLLGCGAGITQYSSNTLAPAIQISIEERLELQNQIGISIGVTHYLEHLGPLIQNEKPEWIGRTQVLAGIYVEI
jgi:hypothetical protein